MHFSKAFDYLVGDLEGDSGKPSIYGDTYGIEPETWAAWQKAQNTNDPISQMGAYHFYRESYWLPLGCESLPDGLDFCVFEWAVNGEGPGRVGKAVMDLQLCVGSTPDGIMGPETIRAARSADTRKVMVCYLSKQVAFYKDDAKKNPDAPLVGWENRVERVCKLVGLDPKLVGLERPSCGLSGSS